MELLEGAKRKGQEKRDFLLKQVGSKLKEPFYDSLYREIKSQEPFSEEIVFLSVVALKQAKTVFKDIAGLKKVLASLLEIERFYESIGGIIGYHLLASDLMKRKESEIKKSYVRPPLKDISERSSEVKKSIREAIFSLPLMGEIVPLGGLGDRLNLKTSEGDPLPTASLPFCGRTLLEGLIRDVASREYLYFKLFGSQVLTPIAMMTSEEKQNAKHIEAICESKKWFNRPKDSFFLFSQISVPVITEEENWCLRENGTLHLQPGGHGALWKTAEERGLYEWFFNQKKQAVLIRQINNPLGGIDHGLFSLIGFGRQEGKVFGFASCKRIPHAAEGALVLEENGKKCAIVNIEYTEFKNAGLDENEAFSANTNILYADLKKLMPLIAKHPHPAFILNMKSAQDGLKIGRLESMMQNISSYLLSEDADQLDTFVTFNKREKTMSVTKKSCDTNKNGDNSLLETPEGAFYDLLKSNWELLELCGFKTPAFSKSDSYQVQGPSHFFVYHPALGPLYDIIVQKLRGGKFAQFSELQLEISEVLIENLDLDGSLIIETDNVMGHLANGHLHYSLNTGKCVLKNVKVRNAGIDRNEHASYWKNRFHRKGKLHIHLQGNAEFYADSISFLNDETIVVPEGERWTAFQDERGFITYHKERIQGIMWAWRYVLEDEGVALYEERTCHTPVLSGTSSR